MNSNPLRAERQRGMATWVVDDKEKEVPRFVCRPGESVDELAKKLGLRALSRTEKLDETKRSAVVAIIGSGDHFPCVEVS